MSGHHGLVLHIAEGTYRGTISWQLNPNQRYKDGTRVTTASTWIVGHQWGAWAQMADTDTIAWCQGSGSRRWNSIELEGFAPAGPTAWQIEACAQLLAWEHRHYGVPLQVASHPGERGLGHHAMDREWLGEQWGHDSCPGAGVIAAKQSIVQRAIEIANGDDMYGDDDKEQMTRIELTLGSLIQGLPETVAQPYHGGKEFKKFPIVPNQRIAALATDVAEVKAALAELSVPTPAPVDVAELVAALTPAMDAAAERALRRVLGAVDGATPAG